MKDFFDLRTFLIAILKKLKLVAIMVLACALLVGVYKALPSVKQYMQKDNSPKATTASQVSQEVLPFKYKVTKSFLVYHLGTSVSSQDVEAAYSAFLKSEDVIKPITDKYYQKAADLDLKARTRLVELNYQPGTILSQGYSISDFTNNISYGNNQSFLTFEVTSYSKELSNQILTDYVPLLSNQVRKLYSHDLKSVSTYVTSIAPQSGTGNARTNIEISVLGKPSISAILSTGIKGMFTGAIIGILLSIILIFFFDAIDLRLNESEEINNLGVKVLAQFSDSKKKHLKFINHWINKLEGNIECNISKETQYDLIIESIKLKTNTKEKNVTVLLTGTVNPESLSEIEKNLNLALERKENTGLKIAMGISLLSNPETLEKARKTDSILIVERRGESLISSIKYEIEQLSYMNNEIIGCIVL